MARTLRICAALATLVPPNLQAMRGMGRRSVAYPAAHFQGRPGPATYVRSRAPGPARSSLRRTLGGEVLPAARPGGSRGASGSPRGQPRSPSLGRLTDLRQDVPDFLGVAADRA